MPKQDQCQPQVVKALQKAGWQTDGRQFYRYDKQLKVEIVIDFEAIKTVNGVSQTLYMEVKCFSTHRTNDLYVAIGQYLAYRTFLARKTSSAMVVLAVPKSVYDEFALLQWMAEDYQVLILAVDTDREEIVQWINWTP